MRPARPALIVQLTLYLTVAALAGYAQTAPAGVSVNGTVAAIDGVNITLTLADAKQEVVTLRASTLVLERQVASFDQIKAGDAMGIAARVSGGKLIATSINIFAPEMWEVVRKGQFPMASGETMTNALATDVVTSVEGNVLTMKVGDATSAITVPAGVPIHKLVALKASDLTVGLHVTARGTSNADGSLTAATVSFDEPVKG
jgi:hypothetical protein